MRTSRRNYKIIMNKKTLSLIAFVFLTLLFLGAQGANVATAQEPTATPTITATPSTWAWDVDCGFTDTAFYFEVESQSCTCSQYDEKTVSCDVALTGEYTNEYSLSGVRWEIDWDAPAGLTTYYQQSYIVNGVNLVTEYLATSSDDYLNMTDTSSGQFTTRALPEAVFIKLNPYGIAEEISFSGNIKLSAEEIPEELTCQDQFTYNVDSLMATIDIDSQMPINPTYDVDDPEQAPIEFTSGEYYAVYITDGSWSDNGDGPRYDLEFTFSDGFSPLTWYDLADGEPLVICFVDYGDGTYLAFLQANADELLLRMNDETLSWDDNSGIMTAQILDVEYEREEDVCENDFYDGDYFTGGSIDPRKENGELIGYAVTRLSDGANVLEAGAWYKLETSGGPWHWLGNLHTGDQYNVDLSKDGGSTWIPLDEWGAWEGGSDCNFETDELGHRSIYFRVAEDATEIYYIRVGDTSNWSTNWGGMSFSLYEANNIGDAEEGNCGIDYLADVTHAFGAMDGDDSGGSRIYPPLEDDEVYAIVIDDAYAWQESSGGEDLYDVQLKSSDGGWVDIANHPHTVCVEEHPAFPDGRAVIAFVRARYLSYDLRVASSSFSDNTGRLEYTIHPTDTDANVCDYGVINNIDHKWIPVKLSEGTTIGDGLLEPGEIYMIDTFPDGPWRSSLTGEGSYDADISSDGGASWDKIDKNTPDNNAKVLCTEVDQIGRWWQTYFEYDTTDSWRVRVADTSGNFSNNAGSLGFTLYKIGTEDIIDDLGDGDGDGDPFGEICTVPCERPESWLDIGQWISYAGCSVQQFFAWCPRHSDLMTLFRTEMLKRDPFATFVAFTESVESVKYEIDAYEWGPEEGGGGRRIQYSMFHLIGPDGSEPLSGDTEFIDADDIIDDYILPRDSDSPWLDGDLINFSAATPGVAYMTSCTSSLSDIVREQIQQGVCFVAYQSQNSSMGFALQLIIDVSTVILFVTGITGIMKKKSIFL